MANKTKAKKDQRTDAAGAASKAEPKKAVAKKKPAKKGGKPGILARVRGYVSSVRSEMRRVVWPTRKELINYSIAVVASLVVVGIVIALFDVIISQGLVLFSGLRG
ncbi:preprotein translocase subunit SecE [Collinsella vaginalis]|uniref:preprotein translocase subunit SecE n=1 Tax=Collinsella vaginalis TaxID=1870987 RepID=UPI000A270226|nr:preprotein translocase subunit SecE [Collinsella vaginalis]